jgi:hypothetical protein
MQIRETTLSFPVLRGLGPVSASRTFVFPRRVDKAVAGVRGYQIGFAGDDHHVGMLQVTLETEIDQNAVTVTGKLGCRDWSGAWDDDYGGSIQVSLLADLAPISEPPPRGDLSIVDLEINQATQFFRSAEHLDTANVRPDNSIPLVAGKSTGLRVYVDYDSSSGLPPIGNLSGQLTVSSGGATATFGPLAPIQPRRATEINRASVGHTLNFLIPGAWCDGVIDVSVRVFDAGAPAQASGTRQRTLHFVRVNPLRVYAVGVNYTGMSLNLPAPTETTFATTFDYTRRVWPTGQILLSGYTTIEFAGNLSGVASDGCGTGFNDLLDELQDLKGDTDDLVYGLLPSGTPLTGVAGCGGNGAGSGVTGDGVTAAHEAGHAVGRRHAPCDDSARCDSPLNTDDSFPAYGAFVSDSIGEFGFDPENNRVFNPSMSSDFMGYSGNDWISPYTYVALMAGGDPSPSGGAATRTRTVGAGGRDGLEPAGSKPVDAAGNAQIGRSRAEWVKRREQVLFLRVRADGADVTVRPSFTFDAFPRPRGSLSDYEVHVIGRKGELLACTTLRQDCVPCDAECGPLNLHAEVVLRDEPGKLEVRRSGEVLATVDFEAPVELRCEAERTPERLLHLRWEGTGSDATIWYLVQWQDRDGAWRGITPRTTKTELIVPDRFAWAGKDRVRIRILAVELLTTSVSEFVFKGKGSEPAVTVTVYAVPGAVVAHASDVLGRQVPAEDLAWYDDLGGEVGKGDRLPIRAAGRGLLRAVPFGLGVTPAEGFAAIGDTVLPGAPRTKRESGHPHDHPRQGHERGWELAD